MQHSSRLIEGETRTTFRESKRRGENRQEKPSILIEIAASKTRGKENSRLVDSSSAMIDAAISRDSYLVFLIFSLLLLVFLFYFSSYLSSEVLCGTGES